MKSLTEGVICTMTKVQDGFMHFSLDWLQELSYDGLVMGAIKAQES